MKLDPSFISLEEHELSYLVRRWKVDRKLLKRLIKEQNNSRRRVYKELRLLGYTDTKVK